MTTIAKHMRITSLQASNQDVDARKTAAGALKTVWGKINQTDQINAKSAQIASALGGDGTPATQLGAEVEKQVQKRASAFVHADRPLEVGIVAGVAAIELLASPHQSSGWLIADVYAASLWSALGFQAPLHDDKREALRRDVLNAARDRFLKGAEIARQRLEVPKPGSVVAQAAGQITAEQLDEANQAAFQALTRNAALDREELDFLWWAQLGRSRLLNKPLASIEEPSRLVAAAIEGAGHLRRLPCDVHRDVVLRTLAENREYDLPGLLAELGDDRATLGEAYLSGSVAQTPAVFPLLSAIARNSAEGAGDSAAVKRRMEEWAGRALLEAGLARMQAQGLRQL